MNFKIVLEKGADGFVVAHCPALKGCWSQGRTDDEAIDNIKEAIELYLEPDPAQVKPDSTYKVLQIAL